jgi:glycosyltransferase involved in cell wall biosynthesis
MKHNILCISSWYPTRLKPTLGNFVFKHIECACIGNNVRAFHVCVDPQLKSGVERITTEQPFHSTVIYIPQNNIPILGKAINYLKIIRLYLSEYEKMMDEGFTPDLVHANVVYPIAMIAWLFKRKFGVNYVISEHWTGYHDYAHLKISLLQRFLIRFSANRAECILPVSEDLQKAMRNFGIKNKFEVIGNVVDTDLFVPLPNREVSEEINLIHISHLNNDQKNISLLLKAFAEASHDRPNCRLHIIHDGDLSAYDNKIDELGISDKISSYGPLETLEVAKTLQKADFFVLSSNYENLPCVLIESLSCGVPVVSTNVGGISEIINTENGILVKPNDLSVLVNALKQMMMTFDRYDKTKLHAMAEGNFSYPAIGEKLSSIYANAIKTPSAHV